MLPRLLARDQEAMPNPEIEDHYYRAIDLFGDGNVDAAIVEFQKAIEIDPTFTDALHGLTRAFLQKGDFRQAIEYARKIEQADPNDALAHTNLSICYLKVGMIKEAEEEAARAKILGWKQQLGK